MDTHIYCYILWVSDQGSHFKKQRMRLLAKEHRIRHNFTVAYSPWVNGTVENIERHICAACNALLTELKLAPQDWPTTIPLITSILSEAPLEHLGKRTTETFRTPLEVMTSIQPDRNVLVSGVPNPETMSIERIRAEQLVQVDALHNSIDRMHKETAERLTLALKKQIDAHNKRTNIITPFFCVGDFVLVRRAQDKGHKLNFRWQGPRRIVKVHSDLVYDVAKLNGGEIEKVHCARLLLYRNDDHNKPVSESLLELADRTEAQYELVDKIIGIGEDHDGIFLHVQWLGLPDEIDRTWVPLTSLFEDMPDMVQEFLRTHIKEKSLVKRAKQSI